VPLSQTEDTVRDCRLARKQKRAGGPARRVLFVQSDSRRDSRSSPAEPECGVLLCLAYEASIGAGRPRWKP
jgi:hypothetical protein